MNPVAVAQLMTGAKPDLNDARAVNDLLKTAYDIDALHLFDGEGAAGERIELLNALARAADDTQSLDEVMKLRIAKRAIDVYGYERVSRVLPFLAPLRDALLLPAGAPLQPHHLARWEPCTPTTMGAISWQDPLQGTIADCYLIAPMIAIAWAAPAFWSDRVHEAFAGARDQTFPFAFYDGPATRGPPIRVPLSIAVDDDGRPVFARSSQRVENWPGLVEKAYVMKLLRRRGDPSVADYLAIGIDHMRYPHNVAHLLGGGRPRTRHRFSRKPGGRPSDVVEHYCKEGVVRVPMMAWSWKHGVDAVSPVNWLEAGLFPNHTYAVLGIMRQDNADYVVLRNPYGCSVFRPGGYANGRWGFVSNEHGESEVLLNCNGVSAISREWFDRYISRLGWLDDMDARPRTRKRAPARSRRRK
jgi:hypothetical protein